MKPINKIKKILKKYKANAILINSKGIKRYLNTLTGGGCFLLITTSEDYLIFDNRYKEEAISKKSTFHLRCIAKSKNSLIDELIKLVGVETKLLLESDISYNDYLMFKKKFTKVQVISDELELIRVKKVMKK